MEFIINAIELQVSTRTPILAFAVFTEITIVGLQLPNIDRDCAKRMIVWSVLAVLAVAIFVLSGFALFETAGTSSIVQRPGSPAAASDR